MIDVKMEMETQAFNSWVTKQIKAHNVSTDKAIRKIGFDLLSTILEPQPYGRHPVDTGRARAGWYASVRGLGMNFNFNSGADPERNDVVRGQLEGSFVDHLGLLRLDKYIEFVNSVKYIVFLEYGHSDQAPVGFVRMAMRKMTGKLPKEINDAFIKDWNKFISL